MRELLSEICRVARQCGEMTRAADWEEIAAAEKTSRRDLVTAFDTRVQAYAVETLERAFPGAQFICEEGAVFHAAAGGLVFVIDPIDGTANFVHHFGQSCTSIACVQDGKPVAAAIYTPYRDELFAASAGAGATLNGMPIHVTAEPLADSLVLFGTTPYNADCADETFRMARAVYGRCQDVRRSGSAALDLCYTACGRVGLFFECALSVWDYAAGALIVQEAGGRCHTLTGAPLPFDRPARCSVIAGSEACIRESGLLRDAEG